MRRTLALLTALPLGLALHLAPAAGAELAATAGLPGIAQELGEVGTANAAFIRRGKIRKRVSVGYKVVVVVGDDADTNDVSEVEVVLDPAPGAPEPSARTITLPLKVVKANGNKRFVYKDLTFSDDPTAWGLDMTSTMLDADGFQVGDVDERTVEVEDADPMGTRSVGIQQLDDTNFQLKVVVGSDFDEQVARIQVEFTDLVGNPVIPEAVELEATSRNGGKAVFTTSTLTFEDPSSAVDQPYGVIVTLLRDDNVSLGSSDYEIVVEGMEVI